MADNAIDHPNVTREDVRRIIREVTDPVEFRRQMEEMFAEERAAESAFKDGAVMPMHEFVRLFRRWACEGNETRFWQWEVRVRLCDGEVSLVILPATQDSGAKVRETLDGEASKG